MSLQTLPKLATRESDVESESAPLLANANDHESETAFADTQTPVSKQDADSVEERVRFRDQHDETGSGSNHEVEGRVLIAEERRRAERELVRKLDHRLMPCLVVIFIMNYVSRSGITSARLKGLEHDLGLSDMQFDTVLAILYVSYCPAQIPSNMIINRVKRPSIYIGCCVVLWGLTSGSTSLTQGFSDIMWCRVLIGLPEAAFYPGAMYLLSRWYTRKELAFRSAILYFGSLISMAFSSLMAAAILANMENVMGIRAWRWLFIIEGAITVVVGISAMYILPDFPHNTRWLTPDERRLAQVRLAEDAGEADEDTAGDSAWQGVKDAITDPKVALFSIMMVTQLLGLSFVNFFPTITATLGYSTTVTLLIASPPWLVTSIACLFNAWHCDRTGERFFHIAIPWFGVMLGYIICIMTSNTAARYFSLYLMSLGYAGFALTLVWLSGAIPRPPAKRAAAIGLVNGFGNLGNAVGAYAWKAAWGPLYRPSMWIALISLIVTTILGLCIRTNLILANKKLDREQLENVKGAARERIEDAARLEGITFEEALERKKGFRYLY
ncbi:MFS general substrate transporter [Sistotremastrum suecicum HHB10207 ss-3]|uniref:MFS general substrate transporter n=1 Tax=Sistotremastrum suecicum HHB10207 ss-3 TaxID=1314776 RepID=A0A166E7W1_9AGAM|nr:MFS general substrate transporter [Sistotremastrum suecicum HHB10207 ss-3]